MLKNYLMLFLIAFSMGCFARENPVTLKYSPPYPDVWGYDLSEYPAFKAGGGSFDAYRMKDGDIWFLIDYSYEIQNPMVFPSKVIDKKYILIKFFTGEKRSLTWEEGIKLYETIESKEKLDSIVCNKAHFSDGSHLELITRGPPRLCFVPDFGLDHFKKTNSNGQVVKYSVLGALPQIRIWQDDDHCDHQGAPFFYQKLYLFSTIVDLGDDTFIVFSTEGNLILRFDKDLKTKFKPVTPVYIQGNSINRNFFVVAHALIEDLEKKYMRAPVPVYQTIHDELLVYLSKEYPI